MDITKALPQLSASVARQSLRTLLSILPLPVPDTPENRARRDAAAAAALVALRPADAYEAMLAVQILACEVGAADCLRLAARPDADAATARRGHTLAASMKKLAQSEFRDLQRRQSQREKPGRAAPPPPALTEAIQAIKREAEAKRLRAERIRALDLRMVETPPTMH
jgi:hypothetical protein